MQKNIVLNSILFSLKNALFVAKQRDFLEGILRAKHIIRIRIAIILGGLHGAMILKLFAFGILLIRMLYVTILLEPFLASANCFGFKFSKNQVKIVLIKIYGIVLSFLESVDPKKI